MQAHDVMTRDVMTIDQNATVLQAVRMMLQHKISGLPVVDASGGLVGVVTEGDLLRRTETNTERQRPRWLEFLFVGPGKLADEYVHTHSRKVIDIMSPEPVTVTENAGLEEVIDLMERHRVKRLPVMQGPRIVGIVSRANLLRTLASVVHIVPASGADDVQIKEQLLSELKKQDWAPIAALETVVLNGIVDIWGTVTDDRVRLAILVLAENIPGVKGVKDHLVWIDPMTGMVIAPAEMSPDRTLVA